MPLYIACKNNFLRSMLEIDQASLEIFQARVMFTAFKTRLHRTKPNYTQLHQTTPELQPTTKKRK